MKRNSKKPVISSSMPGVRAPARFERKDPFPLIPFDTGPRRDRRGEFYFWVTAAVCAVAIISAVVTL